MNIAALGGWLKQQLDGNKPGPLQPQPQQTPYIRPELIKPGMALPTYTPNPQAGFGAYSVQGLPQGTSTFADVEGLGVLKNPPSGVVYFDPTGQAGAGMPHDDKSRYAAVPMAMPNFQRFEFMQPIGGNHGGY